MVFTTMPLTLVSIDTHEAVPLVMPRFGIEGTVDRYQMKVGAQPVAMGVPIGEKTALRRIEKQ